MLDIYLFYSLTDAKMFLRLMALLKYNFVYTLPERCCNLLKLGKEHCQNAARADTAANMFLL